MTRLRDQGVDFLKVPSSYYRELTARVGKIDEPLDQLEDLGVNATVRMTRGAEIESACGQLAAAVTKGRAEAS